MRVPEARSRVGINTLSTATSSPDDFGAAVGRGIEAVGSQVAKLGGIGMDAAIEMKRQKVIREAEDGYAGWLKQANDISNAEVFGKAGAQTDALLDDEENPENSGFRINYTSKLDKAFNEVSEKMSPNAKQRLGVMVQNQRLAYETRARNHVFTQQKEAAKVAAGMAVDAATGSFAQQARAYTQKQPDGTVNVQWSEVDRVMGDVVSAQAIYNARTGTPNEITLPDGTKKNVLAETARAGAHQKAIETLMAVGEFDEAQAYLDGMTAEKRPDGSANPYLNDFDGKQVKTTKEAIRSGKQAAETALAKEQNESLVIWQLENPGKLPSMEEARSKGWNNGILLKIQNAHQKAKESAPQVDQIPDAMALRSEILKYRAEDDPDRAKQLGFAVQIEGFKSDATKSFLRDVLGRVVKTDANDVDSRVKTQIEDALGTDFQRGWGSGWSEREKLDQIALEKSVYDQWVQEKNPSAAERMAYTTTGRFADLQKSKDLQRFKTTLQRSFAAPSESGIEAVRKTAQGQYSRGIVRQVVGVRKVNGVVVERVYADGSRESVK